MSAQEEFSAAYDALLARWPDGTRELDVPTPYGSTRVHAYGPPEAPPLVLLHGGGATGTVWFGNARALGARHRVLAVDVLRDAGRSVPAGRPLGGPGDLTAWLDAVLDGLGVARARLLGHSYGAWIATSYALYAPGRVDRLVLLDPTQCFGGFRAGFLLRSLPLLARPTRTRALRFVARETAGTRTDPEWQRLYALAAEAFAGRRPVTGRRLDPAGLRAPLLVLLAERSAVHDAARIAVRARASVPHARVEVLPGLTHFALPTALPEPTNRLIADFLDGAGGGPAPR
ncbi:alpha/beta hydrolase [Streptomyces sp. NPDC093225]|uniref:alpha/beta fold hydrolase n=1 Tax=Streptomyces sp. NPDC093225 TaxID=3366034 RepID=UPI00382CC6F0